MSKELKRVGKALESAKLYLIRYPNNGDAKVMRYIEKAQTIIIQMQAAEPKYDRRGNELQGCEACEKLTKLDKCHLSEDGCWFCAECVAAWQAADQPSPPTGEGV